MHAFILLSCNVGTENEVLEDLKKMDGIKDATMTYGDYDIVAKAETNSGKEMDVLISTKIRQMQKVRSTVTLHVTD
jgi:DNA-binding Lrp family transcriptional regulator